MDIHNYENWWLDALLIIWWMDDNLQGRRLSRCSSMAQRTRCLAAARHWTWPARSVVTRCWFTPPARSCRWTSMASSWRACRWGNATTWYEIIITSFGLYTAFQIVKNYKRKLFIYLFIYLLTLLMSIVLSVMKLIRTLSDQNFVFFLCRFGDQLNH